MVVRVRPPPVAVIVIVYVPRTVLLFVRTVSVDEVVPGTLRLLGLKLKLVPLALGLTLAESDTRPLNPPLAVSVME